MSEVKNCMLPTDLLYHVENNVWIRPHDDGTLDLGLTDIAQTMAGSIIHCRPKKAGKVVKKGRSVAIVESGKWVGPVRSPFTGEIIDANTAVESDAAILNKSPYKEGWIVKLNPSNFDEDSAELVSGDEAVSKFEEYMNEKDLTECIHCEGFEGQELE
ncbi:MAG TPA: glycine cleavage system protein H [Candidatus Marinimicrobia bacterium]|jgi:glycine cleavage system H protein|nr:glycine cleavage system protein H [Candidatus Neomarinimicrobiota bacterium]MDP7122452.1 glycine cleavage system protein H [Candidatus Neomarinimicrobiota bacterium]MDP7436367.1 glycine cleavage system protein H [Candidatus Neomarinimicrobiota bacterium]MDP7528655.1 glycine cleavage system protein H [Candidatus Neomarinimicrobiota bacterium]MDP7715658.1 glycine cleavage system protein H [Candidatus Neomarinimicrobiota bacterium]|tara:strand:- start:896 stop:1369 length:474 start_codon:yes stop_codon:yes gene_type:complete